jgi:PAS domain-containing protein
MHEALLMVSAAGDVEFMNASAERLTGRAREQASGRHIKEVLDLRDTHNRPLSLPDGRSYGYLIEQFGLSLNLSASGTMLVDLTIAPLADEAGRPSGYVVTLRKADERLRSQSIKEEFSEIDAFDLAPVSMVQLDSSGYIVRVNQALLQETGVAADSLVGRTLAALGKDPDPRIAKQLIRNLLQAESTAASTRQYFLN